MADDDVSVRFGADVEDVKSGIDEVKSKLGEIADNTKSAGDAASETTESFIELGKRVLEAFAVEKVSEFVEHITEAGEQIERISAMTGLSGESVQTLGFAMERTGGNAEAAGIMITRFERSVDQAAGGSGTAYNAFQKLRTSLQDLQTLSIDQLVERAAQGFRDLTDPVERAAVAAEVGGRGWAQMLPAILEAADGLRTFHDKLVELNDDLSEKTVKALADTHGKFVDLGRAAQGAGVEGVLVFKGAIDGVLEDLTAAVVDVGRFIGFLDQLRIVLAVDLVDAVNKFLEMLRNLGIEATAIAKDIEIRYREMGAVLTDIATFHWSQIADIQREAAAEMADNNKQMVAGLRASAKQYDDLAESARKAAGAMIAADQVVGGSGATGSPPAHRTGIGGTGSGGLDSTDYYAQDLRNYQAYIELKETQDKGNIQAQIADAQQWVDAMAAAYGTDSEQYYKAVQKKTEFEQQAAKQSEKTYQDVFNLINRDFDQMLTGVLQGTQTWEQAMGRLFDNLAISFIEAVSKMILKWAAFEALGIGSNPFSGGLIGAVGGLLSFDVGTSYVPKTGPALIHQGEIILPPDISAQVRSGNAVIGAGSASAGTSGGDTYNVSINAVDAQSVANLLRNNAAVVTGIVNNATRNFSANVPAWRAS